ncbi:MAG: hypothetical protein IKG87_14800 [Clostridia bacterium]|nr:hypothetical protein [Clostridia bacterium]
MDDYIGYFARLYELMISQRRNEDYEINPKQMDKFLDLLHFFRGKINPEYDEGIEPFHLEAREEHGGFNADFCVFDISGEEIPVFAQLISCCSAITIDARTDSQICISLTVPNIFVEREE